MLTVGPYASPGTAIIRYRHTYGLDQPFSSEPDPPLGLRGPHPGVRGLVRRGKVGRDPQRPEPYRPAGGVRRAGLRAGRARVHDAVVAGADGEHGVPAVGRRHLARG